jgi:hypothetical protein
MLNNRNQLAQAQTDTAAALASVYQALGGGWVLLGCAGCAMSGSAAPRRLYRGNFDFSHRHHRVERALGRRQIGVSYRRD